MLLSRSDLEARIDFWLEKLHDVTVFQVAERPPLTVSAFQSINLKTHRHNITTSKHHNPQHIHNHKTACHPMKASYIKKNLTGKTPTWNS